MIVLAVVVAAQLTNSLVSEYSTVQCSTYVDIQVESTVVVCILPAPVNLRVMARR